MPGASILWALAGVSAGALIALQAPINAQLARAIGSPIAAATVSFISGGVLLAAISLLTVKPASVAQAWQSSPLWLFVTGGTLGAIYVTTVILLVPRLGAAAVMGVSVTGQLLAGLVIDRFGLFGVAMREMSIGRVAGAILLVAGAVLLRVA